MFINDCDFDNVSLGSHGDTFDSDIAIKGLDIIPSHVRSIK